MKGGYEMESLWLLFIILHTISGLVCFISGCLLLSVKGKKYKNVLPVFIASLVGLIIFLVGAIISHWGELDTATRSVYIGLFFLSLYMMYRALRARQKLIANMSRNLSFVDDIGFPLIALFNGFIIVALIDLGAPAVVVIIGAVAAAIIGGRMIEKRKRKLSS